MHQSQYPHRVLVDLIRPAWKGSGFIGQKVAIGIRDMFGALRISDYVQKMRQAGVLDTEKDEHLDRELTRLLTLYGRRGNPPPFLAFSRSRKAMRSCPAAVLG